VPAVITEILTMKPAWTFPRSRSFSSRVTVAGCWIAAVLIALGAPTPAAASDQRIVLRPGKTWSPKRKEVAFGLSRSPVRRGRARAKSESKLSKVAVAPRSGAAPKDAVKAAQNGRTFGLRASKMAAGHQYTLTLTVETRHWELVEEPVGQIDGRVVTRPKWEERPTTHKPYEYLVVVALDDLPKVTLTLGESTPIELPGAVERVKVLRPSRTRSEVEIVVSPDRAVRPEKGAAEKTAEKTAGKKEKRALGKKEAAKKVGPRHVLRVRGKKAGTERFAIDYYLGGKRLRTTLPVRVTTKKTKTKTKTKTKKAGT